MKSKAAVKRIIDKLKERYPDALCSLQYKKDYELLFAVRLSAQCTDERVNQVTPALYARFPTLESFAEADPAEVGRYIHSCGFYNGKARDIVACAQKLLSEYGGKQDSNARALLYALRPYLKEERQEKVERALQLARLFHLGKTLLAQWEG